MERGYLAQAHSGHSPIEMGLRYRPEYLLGIGKPADRETKCRQTCLEATTRITTIVKWSDTCPNICVSINFASLAIFG